MADFSAFYWSRHIFARDRHWMDREAAVALKKLKMVSMPSRAYTSFLRYPLQRSRFYAVFRACFCRYLSEYSDRSSFSCMFTIWTHLTRQIFPTPEFTIAQNYSSVILFFHQNYRRTHSLILSLTPVRNMLRQHLHPLHMDYNEVIAYGMLVDL